MRFLAERSLLQLKFQAHRQTQDKKKKKMKNLHTELSLLEWELFHCVFDILEFDVNFWSLWEFKIDGRSSPCDSIDRCICICVVCDFDCIAIVTGHMKQCVVIWRFDIFFDAVIGYGILWCCIARLATSNDGRRWRCRRLIISRFDRHFSCFFVYCYHLILTSTKSNFTKFFFFHNVLAACVYESIHSL